MAGHLSDPLRKVSINKRIDVCADLYFNAKNNTTQSSVSGKSLRLYTFSFLCESRRSHCVESRCLLHAMSTSSRFRMGQKSSHYPQQSASGVRGTQKFAFLRHSAPIFVTSLGHSEVPSVTCDRFENFLKFWAL
jgi:hypothetical protein